MIAAGRPQSGGDGSTPTLSRASGGLADTPGSCGKPRGCRIGSQTRGPRGAGPSATGEARCVREGRRRRNDQPPPRGRFAPMGGVSPCGLRWLLCGHWGSAAGLGSRMLAASSLVASLLLAPSAFAAKQHAVSFSTNADLSILNSLLDVWTLGLQAALMTAVEFCWIWKRLSCWR